MKKTVLTALFTMVFSLCPAGLGESEKENTLGCLRIDCLAPRSQGPYGENDFSPQSIREVESRLGYVPVSRDRLLSGIQQYLLGPGKPSFALVHVVRSRVMNLPQSRTLFRPGANRFEYVAHLRNFLPFYHRHGIDGQSSRFIEVLWQLEATIRRVSFYSGLEKLNIPYDLSNFPGVFIREGMLTVDLGNDFFQTGLDVLKTGDPYPLISLISGRAGYVLGRVVHANDTLRDSLIGRDINPDMINRYRKRIPKTLQDQISNGLQEIISDFINFRLNGRRYQDYLRNELIPFFIRHHRVDEDSPLPSDKAFRYINDVAVLETIVRYVLAEPLLSIHEPLPQVRRAGQWDRKHLRLYLDRAGLTFKDYESLLDYYRFFMNTLHLPSGFLSEPWDAAESYSGTGKIAASA